MVEARQTEFLCLYSRYIKQLGMQSQFLFWEESSYKIKLPIRWNSLIQKLKSNWMLSQGKTLKFRRTNRNIFMYVLHLEIVCRVPILLCAERPTSRNPTTLCNNVEVE